MRDAMTMGRFREATGRAAGCDGSSHVLFVPEGRTVDDVIAEVVTLGQLADVGESTPGAWVTIECPGGDSCWCRHNNIAAGFTWHHNDGVVAWWDGTRIVYATDIAN